MARTFPGPGNYNSMQSGGAVNQALLWNCKSFIFSDLMRFVPYLTFLSETVFRSPSKGFPTQFSEVSTRLKVHRRI